MPNDLLFHGVIFDYQFLRKLEKGGNPHQKFAIAPINQIIKSTDCLVFHLTSITIHLHQSQ